MYCPLRKYCVGFQVIYRTITIHGTNVEWGQRRRNEPSLWECDCTRGPSRTDAAFIQEINFSLNY